MKANRTGSPTIRNQNSSAWPMRPSPTRLSTHITPRALATATRHTRGSLPCCPCLQAPPAGLPELLLSSGATSSQRHALPPARPGTLPYWPLVLSSLYRQCSKITLFINSPGCLLIGTSECKLLEGRDLVFSAHFVFPAFSKYLLSKYMNDYTDIKSNGLSFIQRTTDVQNIKRSSEHNPLLHYEK